MSNINPSLLGKKLLKARQNKGLRQEDVAARLGVARTTIVAIEKGERQIKPDELIKLSELYELNLNDLLGKKTELESFTVQFRASKNIAKKYNESINKSIIAFENLITDYLELESLTNQPLRKNYPEPFNYPLLNIEMGAERLAEQERHRLMVGNSPVKNLYEILENEVGLRIFFMELPSNVSEMYHFDEQAGGCFAVNIAHPQERQLFSLAHGYAHFLSKDRYSNEIYELNERLSSQKEKFADYFASYFLMPRESVIRKFTDIYLAKESFTPMDLCILANYFGVSVQAMTLRLEDLDKLNPGTWEKIKKSGWKIRDAQKELGLEMERKPEPLPVRYQIIAVEAFKEDLISEGQFAKYMRIDRLEARKVAEKISLDIEGLFGDELFQTFDVNI